ncbi:hypothetical protein [Cryobacterium zongtaii]
MCNSGLCNLGLCNLGRCNLGLCNLGTTDRPRGCAWLEYSAGWAG